MTGFLFDLTFYLAAPVWLLMIFAPTWRTTERLAASPLTVVPILAVYLILAAPAFPELWAAVTTPDLDAFRELTAGADGAGAIWAQIIAWDLLIGQWMFRESRRLALSPWLMSPLLILAILLSPVALLIFLTIRTTRRPTPTPA